MAGGIYIIKPDEQLIEMTGQPYDSESLLQELLAKYPNLLAGDQIDEETPRRWLLISREIGLPGEEDGTNRWSVDHLFLDQDAVPTIVEVKRSSDTRIRREVVGQMLDYAANAVAFWPVETIRAQFESDRARRNRDAAQDLLEFLGGETSVGDFWQKVKINLQAGRIRLIFVADEIPPELRRIVEFLNGQMDPAEVLAVEISQFVSKEFKALVPRVLGQTEAALTRKSGGARETRAWDEAAFIKDLQDRKGADVLHPAREIMAWAKDKGLRAWWGAGKQIGSYVPVLDSGDRRITFIVLYSTGTVEIRFQYLASTPPFDQVDKRHELRRRLMDRCGIEIAEDAVGRLPSFPLARLSSEGVLRAFLEVLDWILHEVRSV